MRQVASAKCGKTERILRLSTGAVSTPDTGIVRLAGPTGSTGAAGPAGGKGDTGATGAAGPAGAQGLVGLTGAAGATGPGTQWVEVGGGSTTLISQRSNILVGELNEIEIECWKPTGSASHALKMAASSMESVFATVSKIGVEAQSTTFLLENAAYAQVGGDRTTNDVWNILVFSLNPFAEIQLKKQYRIKVQITSTYCDVKAWATT